MDKQYGTRPPLEKQLGVRPEAQQFNPNHDDRGEFAPGSGGRTGGDSGVNPYGTEHPGRSRGGFKYSAGQRVKITGEVQGKGKTGRIGSASPSGQYFSVVDRNGNHIGHYHESDLSPMQDRGTTDLRTR